MTTSAFSVVRLADRHGPVLAGRDLAEEIRNDVEARVARGEQVVIDLDGVQAVSPSFADELFGKLPVSAGGRVRFENVNPHLQDVARMARAGRPSNPADDGSR